MRHRKRISFSEGLAANNPVGFGDRLPAGNLVRIAAGVLTAAELVGPQAQPPAAPTEQLEAAS